MVKISNGYIATSLKDALAHLSKYELVPYAGGTDLMTAKNRKDKYLFLNKISELKHINIDGDTLNLGACCTFAELLESTSTPAVLKEALSQIAAPAIRNEGTIGGNIANASAKADSALIFCAADAKLKISSTRGDRFLPINDFYIGQKRSTLEPDELIIEIQLPLQWLENYYYCKIGPRKSLAISRVSFVGFMNVQNNIICHCATAFGAVSDKIIRCREIDELLSGKTIEEAKKIKFDYLKAYENAIVPSNGRVSAEYRKAVCNNLLKDFLNSFGI